MAILTRRTQCNAKTHEGESGSKNQHIKGDDVTSLELHSLRHEAIDFIKGQSHIRAMQAFQVTRIHNDAFASRRCVSNVKPK